MINVPDIFILQVKHHRIVQSKHIELVHYHHKKINVVNEVALTKHLILFVIAGTKSINSAGCNVVIPSGHGLLIPKGEYVMSEAQCQQSQAFESLLMFFDDDYIVDFAADYINYLEIFPNERTIDGMPVFAISNLMNEVLQSTKAYVLADDGIDNHLLPLKLNEIMLQILKSDCRDYFLQLTQRAFSQRRNMGLHQFMEQNYMQPWSIEYLAKEYCLSLSSFKRKFKEMFDIPPKRWINARRVKAARIELLNGSRPIIDIALSLGFADGAHFSKIFKQELSCSPQSYRKMNAIHKKVV